MSKIQQKIYVGIDVGKEWIDVFASGINEYKRYKNQPRDYQNLIQWLSSQGMAVEKICMESSGGYERKLLNILSSAHLPVCRVNAKWVRDFAKAKGYLAKTDKVDARILSEYADKMSPTLYEPLNIEKQAFKNLYLRRQQLIQLQMAEKNRLEKFEDDKLLKASINRILRQLEKEIVRMDKLLDGWLNQHPDCQKQLTTIISVQGIGRVTAIALLALLPELGRLNRGKITSLAGLAPMNRKRFINHRLSFCWEGFMLLVGRILNATGAAFHNLQPFGNEGFFSRCVRNNDTDQTHAFSLSE